MLLIAAIVDCKQAISLGIILKHLIKIKPKRSYELKAESQVLQTKTLGRRISYATTTKFLAIYVIFASLFGT